MNMWPPRSPDLKALDFYLWGHLRALVYSALVHNVETLQQNIVIACQAIRNNSGDFNGFDSAWKEVPKHVRSLLEEILNIYCNASFQCCKLERKRLRTRAYVNLFPLFSYVELISKVCPHSSDSLCIYLYPNTHTGRQTDGVPKTTFRIQGLKTYESVKILRSFLFSRSHYFLIYLYTYIRNLKAPKCITRKHKILVR
jgi:hypothetical protein